MMLPDVIIRSGQLKGTLMRKSIIAVTIMFALAACAKIPNAELSQYRAAFDKADTVKDEVLINFDAAISEATSFVEDSSEPVENRSPFSSSLNASTNGPDALKVRQAAWRVIERYNATLADLAEGKSDEEVKSAVGGFGDSIGKFVQAATGTAIPGFGAIIEIAQTIAGRVEEARRTKEFKRAVREGGPLVQKILDALYEDANDQFTIKQGLARDTFNNQSAALTTSISDMYLLLGSHQAPVAAAPPVVVASPAVDLDGEAFLSTINERLNMATLPLAKQLVEYPFTLAWAVGNGEPFTLATKNTVDLRLVEVEQRAAAMVAVVQEVGGIGEMLRAYQTLLTKTKDALVKLDQALDAPINIENEVDEIIATVFKIKQGIEKYRMAREKTNTGAPPVAASPSAGS